MRDICKPLEEKISILRTQLRKSKKPPKAVHRQQARIIKQAEGAGLDGDLKGLQEEVDTLEEQQRRLRREMIELKKEKGLWRGIERGLGSSFVADNDDYLD